MSDSMGCDMCRYYSALREPREREDGAVIYGYCFATGTKDYNGNMGKGYAVFVPDSGVCEKFKRIYKKAEKAEESKRQMSLEDLSIERLKSENAALQERLEKAVELPVKVGEYQLDILPWRMNVKKSCIDNTAKLEVPIYLYIKCETPEAAEAKRAELEDGIL